MSTARPVSPRRVSCALKALRCLYPEEHGERLLEEVSGEVRAAALRLKILGSPEELEDLLQAGSVGVLDAVERFRRGKGASFSTYMQYHIRSGAFSPFLEVRKLNGVGKIAPPVCGDCTSAMRGKGRNRKVECFQSFGGYMCPLCGALYPAPRRTVEVSMDMPVAPGGGSPTYGEVIEKTFSSDCVRPDEAAEINEVWLTARRLLSVKKWRALVLRFREGMTFEEIGWALGGLTKERARQIVNRALAVLRENRALFGGWN